MSSISKHLDIGINFFYIDIESFPICERYFGYPACHECIFNLWWHCVVHAAGVHGAVQGQGGPHREHRLPLRNNHQVYIYLTTCHIYYFILILLLAVTYLIHIIWYHILIIDYFLLRDFTQMNELCEKVGGVTWKVYFHSGHFKFKYKFGFWKYLKKDQCRAVPNVVVIVNNYKCRYL